MKHKIIILSFISIIALFAWFYLPLRSYLVMSIFSAQNAKESVMKNNNFNIKMESASGWYPFVLTYNATGFSNWSDIDADMTVMYNFAAFDAKTRTSEIYDATSDKYSAFYGAYAIDKKDRKFGFKKDEIYFDEIYSAFKYDYTQLILRDFGCENQIFDVVGYTTLDNVDYAGTSGWTRLDANITTNGVAHNYTSRKRPYLQYGRPMEIVNTDFEKMTMYGRLYIKYFEDYNSTIMIYVIASNSDTINECDEEILVNTQIS